MSDEEELARWLGFGDIVRMLNTAFGAGVYDIGPPPPGTEGSRSHHQNGYAQSILDVARRALIQPQPQAPEGGK